MKRTGILASILTFLLAAACGSGVTEIIPPVLPYNPVDEGWKVLANYEYAYNNKDVDLLAATLDTEFLHHLLEENWADYDEDGVIDSSWGYELEMEFEGALLDAYDNIEFYLTGEEQYTWPDDPSGESIAFPRDFELKAYNTDPLTGLRETGQFTLVCKPGTNNIWHLTHLIDI